MTDKKNEELRGKEKTSAGHPDSDTLNKTDPQEHMKGPISSRTKNAGHTFETNETRDEAEKVRDRNV